MVKYPSYIKQNKMFEFMLNYRHSHRVYGCHEQSKERHYWNAVYGILCFIFTLEGKT